MLRLEINIGTVKAPDWQVAWLGDESINMQCVNPVFDTDAGGAFSEEFELDCEMNRHIVGNVDELDGMSVFKRLYGKRFRLSFDGVPVMYGIVRLDKEVEMEDGKVSIELASANREWDELLEGKGLQDLDFIEEEEHRVQVGWCFPDYPLIECTYRDMVTIRNFTTEKGLIGNIFSGYDTKTIYSGDVEYTSGTQRHVTLPGATFPRIMFPRLAQGGDFVNVSHPYVRHTGENPYCNIRTCLQKYRKEGDSWTAMREYNVHEPQDINTAPCFYTAYVMERVFEALDIAVDDTICQQLPDFYRLTLMHTNCAYTYKTNDDTPIDDNPIRPFPDTSYKSDESNGNLLFANEDLRIYYSGSFANHRTAYYRKKGVDNVQDVVIVEEGNTAYFRKYDSSLLTSESLYLYKAYATSQNLPDIDFSEFFDGLRDLYGIRYIYDAQNRSVAIVSLSNILSTDQCSTLPVEVIEHYPIHEDIRGFCLKYNASAEYKHNALTGMLHYTAGADDTTYNYYDYRRAIPFGPSAKQQTITTHTGEVIPINYKDMLKTKSDTNMNLYIDTLTGNKYRFKVDGDAKKTTEWYPSLFEVGGFRDVRLGDCSNDERTETIAMNCSPVISNDINGKEEWREGQTSDENITPIWPSYAMMIDGETYMTLDGNYDPTGEEYVQHYTYDEMGLDPYYSTQLQTTKYKQYLNADIGVGTKLNWDATKAEPFTDGEASFTLGIMRGSGSDARREIINPNYDGEGNANWINIAGSSGQTTADSVDSCGGWYDYNGDEPGLGYDKALSLKIKAEAPYKGGMVQIDENGKEYLITDFLSDKRPVYNEDGQMIGEEDAYYPIDKEYAKRGLFDQFYTEYAHFVLNRKIVKMKVEMELATLLNIDMTKKYKIGDVVGWIKQYSYTLDTEKGLSNVEVEMYYL